MDDATARQRNMAGGKVGSKDGEARRPASADVMLSFEGEGKVLLTWTLEGPGFFLTGRRN